MACRKTVSIHRHTALKNSPKLNSIHPRRTWRRVSAASLASRPIDRISRRHLLTTSRRCLQRTNQSEQILPVSQPCVVLKFSFFRYQCHRISFLHCSCDLFPITTNIASPVILISTLNSSFLILQCFNLFTSCNLHHRFQKLMFSKYKQKQGTISLNFETYIFLLTSPNRTITQTYCKFMTHWIFFMYKSPIP